MTPLYYLRSFQNILSFALRSQMRFKKNPKENELKRLSIVNLQNELLEFLDLFDWVKIEGRHSLVLADVGCRDFSFAPVYEKKFEGLGFSGLEVHGIEIDAYRRYSNLCSRADYGQAFAQKIKRGFYHPVDFMDFSKPVDVIFLLHPFVTPEPPVRWGLPLSTFKPLALVEHCHEVLKEKKGLLLLSNPSANEFEISLKLATDVGFKVVQKNVWNPTKSSSHQRPRFGALLLS